MNFKDQKRLDIILHSCINNYKDAHGDADTDSIIDDAQRTHNLTDEERNYIYRNMLRSMDRD